MKRTYLASTMTDRKEPAAHRSPFDLLLMAQTPKHRQLGLKLGKNPQVSACGFVI
jgi:hypothetical protein